MGAGEENSTVVSVTDLSATDLEANSSAEKIVNIESEEHTSPSGLRLIDLGILSNVLSFLACP